MMMCVQVQGDVLSVVVIVDVMVVLMVAALMMMQGVGVG